MFGEEKVLKRINPDEAVAYEAERKRDVRCHPLKYLHSDSKFEKRGAISDKEQRRMFDELFEFRACDEKKKKRVDACVSLQDFIENALESFKGEQEIETYKKFTQEQNWVEYNSNEEEGGYFDKLRLLENSLKKHLAKSAKASPNTAIERTGSTAEDNARNNDKNRTGEETATNTNRGKEQSDADVHQKTGRFKMKKRTIRTRIRPGKRPGPPLHSKFEDTDARAGGSFSIAHERGQSMSTNAKNTGRLSRASAHDMLRSKKCSEESENSSSVL
eukprot:IDg5641t1